MKEARETLNLKEYMETNSNSTESNVQTFSVAEKVEHKLGFIGLVHSVTKEIRSEQGMIQELEPADFVYTVGYMDNNGVMQLLKVNYPVLEKYVE